MPSVLLVDDDVAVRAVARRMLESAGVEVTEAGDGAEGMRAFRRRPADVVLCDLFMPGKDGLELIRELRSESAGVRIVAMSGGGFKGTVDVLPAARRLGAAKVLYKPFNQAGGAGRDPRSRRAYREYDAGRLAPNPPRMRENLDYAPTTTRA